MKFLSHGSVSTFNLSIRLWQSTMATKAFGSTTSRLMLGSCENHIEAASQNSLLHLCQSKANNYRQSWGKWWYPWDGTLNNQPHHRHLMSQQQSVFRRVVLVAALEFCGYQQKKALNQVLLLYWWDLSLLVGRSNEILWHGHSKGALCDIIVLVSLLKLRMPRRPDMFFLVQTYSRWSWTLHLLLSDTSYINDKMYTVCLDKVATISYSLVPWKAHVPSSHTCSMTCGSGYIYRKQRCAVPRFACFCFLLIFLLSRVKMISNLNFLSFEFWNLKLHHTTKWKTKDSQECLGPGFSSEACSFFHRTKIHTRNVWAKNCFFKVAVNWFSSLFFGFGLRRLIGYWDYQKPKNLEQKPKKTKKPKKPKDSEECLGQGLCSEALVFLFFLVFLVFLEFFWFWAPEAFIGYWNYQKPKNLEQKPKKPKKTKKPKDSEECLGQGLCSEALVFLFFLVFLEFFWFWAPEAFIGY